ncbi:indole-3-glycerol phosphate synthase [Aliiroseovarius halocynthiae]|uniref:Indole-3-glycerol phosphate synthase n=1 Tax=Aliiroseovarius halocynthiae TaxID=985055 RepID=A0A545SSG9_9RHOB|nr:indole-3-glycerol phosphate synthase TrpC [Aliiroseovarius halocynthiae]TQV67885.1 indole-3-glycerol phosphate synthase TrpC [Aliiroseovarius halocynthiae]SMR72979.1 indole-3-glycerol phosphate synthase [Aliiroseovarius halocynthiae]
MSTVLDKIKAYKLEHVAACKAACPLSEVEAAARDASPTRGFATSLMKDAENGYGMIAEVKKASPSKGLIREDFNPPEIATAYEAGGASCLSVLTDAPSFQGADEFLVAARSAVSLPALRKDFMYDTYQVAEARALGADCILIIMASVEDSQAQELEDAAFSWGMDVLVEVHDEEELDRATILKSPLLGVNNRNLKTFETTLDTTRRLSKLAGKERHLVCESGLFTPQDLADMATHGARSFLIGESLMRQDDVEAATRALLANPVPA